MNSLSANKNLIIDTTRPATPNQPTVLQQEGVRFFNGGKFVDVKENRTITLSLSCLVGGKITLYNNEIETLATSPCTTSPLNITLNLSESAALYDFTSIITNAA